ncbi:leucine-rich repeat-containing protein 69-like [Metopolophium dirhodum]|uniref:leucine-rich repeat-containing protein 69-like n=1 Tax=Metopolophium dirhodum TaxID=44670 RepID=UPI0029904341|nr:leucine-rich repeat-containing protein 69-like [Metopolophium dirhodum]
MLIHCSLIIQDLTAARPNTRSLRSCVMTKKENDEYYVCVKNSMYPTIKSYKLTMLQNIYHSFIKEGKMGLEFSEPRQALLIVCEDKRLLYLFFRQLKSIINGNDVIISTRQMPKNVPAKNELINRFDPSSLQYVAVSRFDNRVLNMRHLSKLVLEDCDLPTIPVQIGHLPIKYLSITGSKLPTSKNEQDVFWNWTSGTTICYTLTTLKMDSVGIKKLPFEIFFLKNLQTLSASNNSLAYLPQFIGDLKKLESLFVADNLLVYFPHILSCRTFKEVDISNNSFQLPKSLMFDHITEYLQIFGKVVKGDLDLDIKPLNHLAFYNMLENWIPFKRQDIPRTLWTYFEVVGRCMLCNKWILPDYSRITHTFALPSAISTIKDHTINGIPWQSLICRNSYDCELHV